MVYTTKQPFDCHVLYETLRCGCAQRTYDHSNLNDISTKKEGTLRSFREVVNYPLEKYETDNVIAESDADLMRHTQPSNK